MKRFPLEKNYAALLEQYGISAEEILLRARLPLDLFAREAPYVSAQEYYRFMLAIDETVDDKELPIRLATAENIEAISPPLFAAYCSENTQACIKRIAQYKALVGAIVYETESSDSFFSVVLSPENPDCELPEIVLGVEMVLLVNIIRKATKKNIVPHRIIVRHPFDNPCYEKFLGVESETGEKNALIFNEQDIYSVCDSQRIDVELLSSRSCESALLNSMLTIQRRHACAARWSSCCRAANAR